MPEKKAVKAKGKGKTVAKKPSKKSATKKVTRKGAPIKKKGVKSIIINKYYYGNKQDEKCTGVAPGK